MSLAPAADDTALVCGTAAADDLLCAGGGTLLGWIGGWRSVPRSCT
jgi:hypothetical protein